MVLTQARLDDGMSVWLLPMRSERARNAYLDQRPRAEARAPVQLETVASAVSDSRRVYEVIPYVPYDGYSKLSGVAAYVATQNVLGTRAVAIDDYA